MQRLILIILSTFAFLAGPALAKSPEAANWIVSQRSGDARVIRSGLQPASLNVSAALKPGDVILTGPTGRATLARGSDYIVVAPRSELRLPASPQAGGFTRVVQTIGTMLFKVRRTGVPHFAVDTPMLAAVVKGTTFTIVVGKDRSAVQVIEGAVEVIAADGGMKELVAGGRTVFIDRHEPKKLIIADARTLGISAPSSDDAVKITGSRVESLTAVVGLTGGLVRAEAVPAANTRSASIPDTIIAAVAPAVDRGVPTTADVVSPATNPSAAAPSVATIAQNPTVSLPAATVPAVTVSTVTVPAATVPAVTVPTVPVPAATVPAVTVPTVPVPAATVPAVTVPAVTVPTATVPAVTTPTVPLPVVKTPTVPVPAVTVPAVTVPAVTTPAVTVPAVTVPTVTTPTVPVPAVTVPAVTVPAVTVPVPAVPVPAVTVPAVTTPTVPVPAVTVPAVTTPTVPVPAVTVPAVTVPTVPVPAVTVPAVTVPAVPVPAVTVPTVPVPAVTVPTVPVPAVPVPAVTVPAVTIPAVTVPAVTVPAVTVPTVPVVVPLPKL